VCTHSRRTCPVVNTLSCSCVLPHSMQLQQTSQKLEHAKAMNDGVQKHSRLFRRADELVIECRRASEENHHLKREVTKHRAALADAKSIIDDLQDALLARVAKPPVAKPPVASSAATPPREATPLHTAAQSLSCRTEPDHDWPEGGLGREEPKQRHAVFVRAAKSHSGLSAPSSTDACNYAEKAVRPVSPQLSSSSSNLGMESTPLAWSPSPCRSYGKGDALGPTVTPAPLSLQAAAEQAQLGADAAPSASSASASRKTAAVAGGGLSVARENARPRRQTTNSACLREPSLGSKLRQGDSFTFGTPRPAVRRPTQGAKVRLSKAGEDAGVPETEDGKAGVKSDAMDRKWAAAAQGRSSVLEHMFRCASPARVASAPTRDSQPTYP
jgi:hypothetical protein